MMITGMAIGTFAFSSQFTANNGLIHGKGTVKYLSFEEDFTA
jgi:hypothetical protein